MPRRYTAWLRTFAATAALFVLASAAGASPLAPVLRLRADPNRVPADGETAVAVSVEVLDATGLPVPDGTPVHFDTTLGEIVSPVEVLGGIAQTVLNPSNVAGTALVSAMVGGARATVEVEFLPTAGSASPGSRLVEITADELSYSGERRVFVATWNAELRYQAVEIRADSIHYDMSPNVVCAQGNVTLQSGRRTLRADALRYELRSLRGRLLKVTDGIERLVVEGDSLDTRPDPAEDSRLWEPLVTDDTRTWVKVQRAIVDPGHKVILDHATFYVDDTRVMSLRRHVVDPRSGEALFGNTFGYSSGYGVGMDLPIYYRASGRQVGSLHIARNRAVGGWQYEPGWSLGLREEYFQEGRSEGAFTLQDVAHPDRGVRWEHRHQLGDGSRVSMNASATSFEEDGPRLRSTSASYFRPVSGGRLSLSVARSDFGTSESSFSDLAYRFRTFRVAGDVLAVPVIHLRHSRSYNEQEGIIVDPSTGEPFQITQENTGRTTSPGMDVSFELPTRNLDSRTTLHARLMTGYAWRLSGEGQGILDARLGVTRRTGRTHLLRLDYTYAATPAGLQPTVFSFGRQRLSLSGTTMVKAAQVRFNASRELDGDRSFGAVRLTRPLPFGADAIGRPLWSLDASYFFSRLENYRVASSRFALNRAFGRYRASLCFSPQGNGGYDSRPWMSSYGYGYTYSGGRNVWLEFAAAAP